MSGKKGFLASLFGGGSSGCCNMQITENPDTKGGCRDTKATQATKKKEGCCNMKIVEGSNDPQ